MPIVAYMSLFRVCSLMGSIVVNIGWSVVLHVMKTLMFAPNVCRPMYIDSTNMAVPAGDQTVASLLRDNVEPLLKVHTVLL